MLDASFSTKTRKHENEFVQEFFFVFFVISWKEDVRTT